MKRLLHLSLVLLLLSGCKQTYAIPPVIETGTPAAGSLFPTAIPTKEAALMPTDTPVPSISLRRGINLGDMLEAPNEGDWGFTVHKEYFGLVKSAGFDFVRLPVSWSTHAEASEPYPIDPAFLSRVDKVIAWALEQDLAVILDFHNYQEIMSDPWGHKARYLSIWGQIAEHYQGYPSKVLFELLNEPNDQLDASLWNQYAVQAVALIRQSNPARDIVIGPINWNAYDWVNTLDLPDDPRVIATFHYYLPFSFTHQGAEWVEGSDKWLGTTWQGLDEQKSEIAHNFDLVAEWAGRHGNVRILLGEFGAYSKADMESRVRWTEFVRSEAERHGFAWAYWEFAAGFGIYDPEAKAWREELLKALIP